MKSTCAVKLMAEKGVQRRRTGPKHAQRKEEKSPKMVERSMQRSNANLKIILHTWQSFWISNKERTTAIVNQ